MQTKIFFSDSEDLLDICFDNVFKAVFMKETRASRTALSRLVSAVIGQDVSILAITANEPAVENVRDRQLRFDINCKTVDGEQVNVEMSLNPKRFEPVRLEFHAAKLFAAQDIRGKDRSYNDLKRTYQISILGERVFRDEEFFHGFEYYDPVRGMPLGGRSRIFTLELSKLGEVVRKPAGEMSNPELWAVFFRYLNDPSMREKINAIMRREEGIAMAAEVLLTISRDEAERMRLMSEQKNLLDIQSEITYAKQEGRHENRQEMLSLINKGYTLEDLKRELASQ